MFERLRLRGCNVGLRLRYWHSHLNYLPDNMVKVGEGFPVEKEKVEKYHQGFESDAKEMQGRWDVNMMADYCRPSKSSHL